MPQGMKPGEVRTLRYLRHGDPVPAGWQLADKLEGTHHGWFAVMIVRADG